MSFPSPPLPDSSSEVPHPLEGATAFAFTLSSANGQAVTVSGGESELVVLLFWATWCGSCMESLPQLQQLQTWAEEHGKPLSVYTVNVNEKAPTVHKACKQLGLSLLVLLDVDGRVAAGYGSQGLPHTIVIRGGTIRYVTSGIPLHLVEGMKHELAASAPSDPLQPVKKRHRGVSQRRPRDSKLPQGLLNKRFRESLVWNAWLSVLIVYLLWRSIQSFTPDRYLRLELLWVRCTYADRHGHKTLPAVFRSSRIVLDGTVLDQRSDDVQVGPLFDIGDSLRDVDDVHRMIAPSKFWWHQVQRLEGPIFDHRQRLVT